MKEQIKNILNYIESQVDEDADDTLDDVYTKLEELIKEL